MGSKRNAIYESVVALREAQIEHDEARICLQRASDRLRAAEERRNQARRAYHQLVPEESVSPAMTIPQAMTIPSPPPAQVRLATSQRIRARLMNSLVERILDLLAAHPDRLFSAAEVNEALEHGSIPSVRTTLARLTQRGAIQRAGTGLYQSDVSELRVSETLRMRAS